MALKELRIVLRCRVLQRACLAVAAGTLWATAAAAANSRPMIMGTHGVVVSGHHQASAAGIAMMQQGGNAIDAGVATVFAQAVLEFDRFGIGGEVPILIRLADENRVVAINGQGFAPQAATLDWFKQHGVEYIAGDGFVPATVPAVVESLILALDRFGTKSLGEVLAPAIAVADNGFPMYASFREHIEENAGRLRREWPSSVKVFLPDGKVPDVGDVFVQKDLARTLKRLAAAEADALGKGAGRSAALQAARDLFYNGEIAREIVRFQREFTTRDETGFETHGLFTEEDFASYRARVEEAKRTTYRGIDVYKVGFWSQGPILLQTLNILEGYDLKSLGHNSAAYIHLLSEAMKLAFADREWYYADPDFVGVPEQGLLSKAYAAQRRKLIQPTAPSLELHPGNPYPFQPAPMAHAAIPGSIPFRPDQPGTTGTRVADDKGNVFSATPSGGWFYTSPILEGLGFVLGTRGQSFWLDPDKPNRIEPHKRPRTTLTPSLALKDGKPFLAWGTPGGDVQDQVNLQVFLNVVEFGMNIQQAVDAPLFQILDVPPSFYPRDAFPGAMRVETRIPEKVRDELTGMGYDVRPAGEWSIGDGTALLVDPDRGVMFGAAGPRRDKSYALAW